MIWNCKSIFEFIILNELIVFEEYSILGKDKNMKGKKLFSWLSINIISNPLIVYLSKVDVEAIVFDL